MHFTSRKLTGDVLTRIEAVFLLGTLKPKRGEFSHTQALTEIVAEELEEHDVHSEIVRLVEYVIKPGTKNNMGKGDEWPRILNKVLAADIIAFATPIWWASKESLRKKLRGDKATAAAAKKMAANLAFFARLLRENQIPR